MTDIPTVESYDATPRPIDYPSVPGSSPPTGDQADETSPDQYSPEPTSPALPASETERDGGLDIRNELDAIFDVQVKPEVVSPNPQDLLQNMESPGETLPPPPPPPTREITVRPMTPPATSDASVGMMSQESEMTVSSQEQVQKMTQPQMEAPVNALVQFVVQQDEAAVITAPSPAVESADLSVAGDKAVKKKRKYKKKGDKQEASVSQAAPVPQEAPLPVPVPAQLPPPPPLAPIQLPQQALAPIQLPQLPLPPKETEEDSAAEAPKKRGPKPVGKFDGVDHHQRKSSQEGGESSKPPSTRSQAPSTAKERIEAQLRQAIEEGKMPNFCENCGSIETPTWRRVNWKIKESSGVETERSILLCNRE